VISNQLTSSGANAVALIDLNKKDAEEAAKDLVDWFVKHGEAKEGEIQAVGYGCDVANEQSVKDTFASIEKDFGGKIDVSSHL
jgi:NAD(P)-dependent dehydrogenase (short-subunit alcohol dehydrogenase family)